MIIVLGSFALNIYRKKVLWIAFESKWKVYFAEKNVFEFLSSIYYFYNSVKENMNRKNSFIGKLSWQINVFVVYLEIAIADFWRTLSVAAIWAKSSGLHSALDFACVAGTGLRRNCRRMGRPPWRTTSDRQSALAAMLARTAATCWHKTKTNILNNSEIFSTDLK